MSSPSAERAGDSVAGVADTGRRKAGVSDPGYRRPRTPRRAGIVIVMLAALLGSGGMQWWSRQWQQSAVPGQVASSRAGLGSLDSYALALVLGGLRGPLVMFLWTTSESQKNDRDLEDFDTKIEWIRMLQPEFDTVHMFQIWNKAYNISVMMASPVTKYTTILSAIDYAQDVLAERPDDMNIYESLGQVYSNKLSGESTQERPFYERQFRLESMSEKGRDKVYGPDPDFRRLGSKHFTFLDDNGYILPALLAPGPSRPRPASIMPGLPPHDGSQLQYLKPYEPFPYGILPLAMAYNYDMASNAAMVYDGQLPLQLSPLVTDSRPGLDLKLWAEEEAKMGVSLAGQAFGVDVSADPDQFNKLPLTRKVIDPQALAEAQYRFNLSSRLATDATVQYNRHLANPQYLVHAQTYASHLMDLKCLESLSKGDALFAQYFAAPSDSARQSLLEQAQTAYHSALIDYEREVLLFYTENDLAQKAFHDKLNKTVAPIALHDAEVDLSDTDVQLIYGRVMEEAATVRYAPHAEDRQIYSLYINRASERYSAISHALGRGHG